MEDYSYICDRFAIASGKGCTDRMLRREQLAGGCLLVAVAVGELHVTVDGRDYSVRANGLFLCVPGSMIEYHAVSESTEICMIWLSLDFAERIARHINTDMLLYMMMRKCEVLHIDADAFNMLERCIGLIKAKTEAPGSEFKDGVIDSMFASLSCELCDIRSRYRHLTAQTMPYSAAEHLFQRFLKMLYESGCRMHSVNEYADSLCVSPKYFSAVCRQLTGKSAGALINDDIIRSAQHLLSASDMSLKQITDALYFKNPSHFGTFFRRHTGMTPQQFRDSCKRTLHF